MPLRKTRILLIDDEADLCHFVKANLEMLGTYEVTVAGSGQKGLEMAKASQPDLILLDILMPGINGLEVLKRLKENPKTIRIPVLMLTAVTDQDSKELAATLYDEDYLEKPIEVETLKSKIESTLSKFGR